MRKPFVLALLFITAPAWAQAVQLAYKLRPGEVLDYVTRLEGNGTVQAMGRTSPVTMTGELRYRQAVRSVDSVGRMTVTTTVTQSKVNAQWAGQPLPVNLTFPPVTVIMTPNGQISGSQVAAPPATTPAPASASLGRLESLLGGLGGGLGSGAFSGLGNLSDQVMLFDFSKFFSTARNLGLPRGAVKVGQNWTDITTLASPSGQQISIQSSSRLVGLQTVNGRRCARIVSSYSVPLNLNLQLAQALGITGSQQGSNTTLFAVDLGRPVRTTGTVASRMTMSEPALTGGQATQVAMSMTVKTTTTLAGW